MRSSEDVRDLIASYVSAFNARDFDRVMALYSEDATLEDPVGSGVKRGKAEIRAFYEQFRDQPSFLQPTGDFRFPEDAVAFSFFCYMGPPADPMIVEVTDTFRFDEDGLIVEMRAFWGPPNVHGVASRPARPGSQHPLAGQVILVVGSGPRARACSLALSGVGATVIAAAPAGAAQATADAVGRAGGRALPMPIIHADEGAASSLADDATELGGRLDGCVNVLLDGDGATLPPAHQVGTDQFARNRSGGRIVNIVGSPPPPEAAPPKARGATLHWIVAPQSVCPQAVADTASWLLLPVSGPIAGTTIELSPE